MKRHISFPSIGQFREVVRDVRARANYDNIPVPKITFSGTVKLHGTNAGICSSAGEFWVQSRENIITFEKDNAGFAAHVLRYEDYFKALVAVALAVKQRTSVVDVTNNTIVSVYGEWCGGNIQKGVALTQLPKMFVVFGARIFEESHDAEGKETSKGIWLTPDELKALKVAMDSTIAGNPAMEVPEHRFYSVDFPTYEMEIDFANPEASQNALGEITQKIEDECPVGKFFNVSGTGEGAVWTAVRADRDFNLDGLWFKVKGEAHAMKSKVKTLAPVNIDEIKSMNEFVDQYVCENRLNQGIEKLKEKGLEVSTKNLGEFIRWVFTDILKEESDTMIANQIDPKKVNSLIANKTRQWFLKNLD